jgi:hypothetical protein
MSYGTIVNSYFTAQALLPPIGASGATGPFQDANYTAFASNYLGDAKTYMTVNYHTAYSKVLEDAVAQSINNVSSNGSGGVASLASSDSSVVITQPTAGNYNLAISTVSVPKTTDINKFVEDVNENFNLMYDRLVLLQRLVTNMNSTFVENGSSVNYASLLSIDTSGDAYIQTDHTFPVVEFPSKPYSPQVSINAFNAYSNQVFNITSTNKIIFSFTTPGFYTNEYLKFSSPTITNQNDAKFYINSTEIFPNSASYSFAAGVFTFGIGTIDTNNGAVFKIYLAKNITTFTLTSLATLPA